jgi:predicted transcriptional regulator
MDKQNITLSIRKDILQKVKILAVKQSTSVSALLSQVLEDIVTREEGYHTAHQGHVRLLEERIDLGTRGSIKWSRDELHDR